jgi:hypothetical protein
LKALPTAATAQTDTVYNVVGFYSGATKGGGAFIYDATTSRTLHNGGTIIAPEAVTAWDGTQANLPTLLNWTGTGSGCWVRSDLRGDISPEMFGAIMDGISDNHPSVSKWMQTAIDLHLRGVASDGGVCLLSDSIVPALNNSAEFEIAANVIFKATVGFPAKKLFNFTTGSAINSVFAWRGGQLDGSNIPLSGSGQANDMFYFAPPSCTRCDIYFDRTYSGQDWLNAGSDSHVFVAGADNISVGIGEAVGAVDAAVYISRNFAGTDGTSCRVYGNYTKCNVAVIVKRRFENVDIDISTTDCLNGAGSGGADITGFATAPGGDGFKVKVNSLRTERSCFLQATSGAVLEILARQVGVSIPGYTSTDSFTAYISGSSSVSGVVVTDGVNPACSVNSNFVAARLDQRVFATGTYNPTDNSLMVNARGIGRSVSEDAISARNAFIVSESGNVASALVQGAGSSLFVSGSSACVFDAASLILARALRASRVANAVNNLIVSGSVTGSATGVSISTEGTDPNVPLSLLTKGTSNLYINGPAGGEAIRVGKGGANALEVPTVTAGNPLVLRARGSDNTVDIKLEPKGTAGRAMFGSHTSSADAPITGYIEIKDSGGTVRKLAIIN